MHLQLMIAMLMIATITVAIGNGTLPFRVRVTYGIC